MTGAAWFRIVLRCDGVPVDQGAQAAVWITEGFAERPWHFPAVCTWDGAALTLTVENDFDPDGLATLDEFSDEICGAVRDGVDGDLVIVAIEPIRRGTA